MLARKNGTEIIQFLKSFEGAAAACPAEDGPWSLWVPEIAAGERPVTPASQIYFPVILRHGTQLIAIRFFYDCGSGKIRFYTGAIPARLADLPEFEHAVSELFRHSLPIEPIRQRKLRRLPASAIRVRGDRVDPGVAGEDVVPEEVPVERPTAHPLTEIESIAVAVENLTPSLNLMIEPSPIQGGSDLKPEVLERQMVIGSARTEPESLAFAPVEAESRAVALKDSAVPATTTHREEHFFRVEICDHTRRFLQLVVLVCGVLGFVTLLAFVYLKISEDPGVQHHRMQLEQKRIESGR